MLRLYLKSSLSQLMATPSFQMLRPKHIGVILNSFVSFTPYLITYEQIWQLCFQNTLESVLLSPAPLVSPYSRAPSFLSCFPCSLSSKSVLNLEARVILLKFWSDRSRLWRLPVLNDAVIPFLYVLQSKTILNCKTGVRKFHKVLIFLIVTTSQPLR